VDVLSALEADAAKAATLAQTVTPAATSIDFDAAKNRLQAFANGGQLGPFANTYWGHEAYILSPEANLLLAAHYLQALQLQSKTARMHAVFGGKNPHVQSLRVGGVTCKHDLNGARINEFRSLLKETKNFVDAIYVPDVEFLANEYSDWRQIGGHDNFLAFGEFPQSELEPDSLFFPQGVIFGRGSVQSVDLAQIREHVKHSWYNGDTAQHPSIGETIPNYNGLNTNDRYSWLKAPRYENKPMEVGPLARVLVGYGKARSEFIKAVDRFLSRTDLTMEAMYSTLGRMAARALETQIIADTMDSWLNQINSGGGTASSFNMPTEASGMGLNEAPRGALGNWIAIRNQVIDNYQMVVPSTWNFGPRCSAGKPGPAESALKSTPVVAHQKPVEILRTIHSLDPCIACAVHVIDRHEGEVYVIRVV
jgi:[NiFe] hydrogenase large subunit